MSGKYNKKKNSTVRGKKQTGVGIKIALAAAIVLLCLAVALLICLRQGVIDFGSSGQPSQTSGQTQGSSGASETQADTTAPDIQIQVPVDVTLELGDGLKINDVGSYTGIFMEDGSDEVVSGVMMILVTNESERTLQYVEITLCNGQGGEASFTLSTLPPGASAVVLETNRLPFAGGYNTASVKNLVFFKEEPSLHADKLKIQAYQGALNVTNISEEDITGDILIYYKNSASDVLYGGITYMVRIQGGLEAGELRQLVPSHFNASSSAVMFVVIQ